MRGSRDDTRAAVVAAASELLTRGGPELVTLRAVGTAAGVSRTAPYRHFVDKDDLLSAVAAESLNLLTDAMRHGVADVAAGGTPLYRACLGYVRAAMERPAHYRLMFGDFPIDRSSAELERAADECAKVLWDLVAEAKDNGRPSGDDLREVGTLLWAALHGLVDLTLTRHLHEPRTVDGVEAMPKLLALAIQNWIPPQG